MRLTGLFAGRESVISHGVAISTVADDIANLNTTGFKSQRIDFADLFGQGQGMLYGNPSAPGNGVSAADKKILHNIQGTIDTTGRDLDFAVDGPGFFMLTDGSNTFYTRAGNFVTNSEGNITNLDGYQLLGKATADGPLIPLNVNAVTGGATPTTTVAMSGNLDGGAVDSPPPANPATFAELNAGAQLKSTLVVIDSLGASHDVAVYFHKTGNLTYAVNAYVDAGETGGVAGAPQLLGSSTITFGGDGVIPEGGAPPMAINATWSNGAAASAITADFSGFTGFASRSSLKSVAANGVRNGEIKGYELASNGQFNAILDNGETISVGQLVLAKFNNPDSLQRRGSTIFAEGPDTSEASVGFPGESGRGAVRGAALEASTVDAAGEFVDLIRFQRGYQSGSQVISTISRLLEQTIQIA